MRAWCESKFYDLKGRPCITLRVGDKSLFNEDVLDGRELDLSIKEYRPKRSLNANAYMWALIGQIATKLRIDMTEVYHRVLCDYGTFDTDDGVTQVVTIRSDVKLKDWLYIHTKPIKNAKLDGKMYTHYAVLKGSSNYDTKEMTHLLDGVIYEAKELGIETMTQDELERLKGYGLNNSEQ